MPVSYNFPLRLDDDLREKLRYIAEKTAGLSIRRLNSS